MKIKYVIVLINKMIKRKVNNINEIANVSSLQRIPSSGGNDGNYTIIIDEVKQLSTRIEAMEELKSKLQEAIALIDQMNNKVVSFDSVLNDEYLKNDIQEQRLLKLEMEVMKLKDKR